MVKNLQSTKNLDPAGHGSGHWIRQRISAALIVLFTLSMVILIYDITQAHYKAEIIDILRKPQNIIIGGIFFLASFYHAALGVQVIIEDYVHCIKLRMITILLMQIISVATAASFTAALIYLMSI